MSFRILLFLLATLFTEQVFALSDTTHYSRDLSLSYGRGVFWAHRAHMTHLVGNTINSVEFEYEFKTKRNRYWKRVYDQPTIGIRAHFSDLGNPLLGQAYGLAPYYSFNLIKGKKLEWRSSIGMGLGMLSRHFDLYGNRKNIAIGSSINLYASLNSSLRYAISSRVALNFKAQFTHFSNAAVSMPNLGINVPALTMGVTWSNPKTEIIENPLQELIGFERRRIVLVSGISTRSVSILNDKRYPIFKASLEYQIRPKFKWLWGPSLDLSYNSAIVERLEVAQVGSDLSYNMQLGLSMKYHQIVGPVEICTAMGVFVLDKARRDGLFYHKLGGRLRLNKHWFLNSNIFSHWAKADHFEVGLAYQIK